MASIIQLSLRFWLGPSLHVVVVKTDETEMNVYLLCLIINFYIVKSIANEPLRGICFYCFLYSLTFELFDWFRWRFKNCIIVSGNFSSLEVVMSCTFLIKTGWNCWTHIHLNYDQNNFQFFLGLRPSQVKKMYTRNF